jgi:DNA-binding YbaB/EbfC family protein
MKDFGAMMRQAQGLQQKLEEAQARLAASTVEGQAGGGLVRLTLLGTGALHSVAVDPGLLTPDDAEMLSDLLVAAHAEAKKKLDAEQAQTMQDAMGPLAGLTGGMPGFPGMKL